MAYHAWRGHLPSGGRPRQSKPTRDGRLHAGLFTGGRTYHMNDINQKIQHETRRGGATAPRAARLEALSPRRLQSRIKRSYLAHVTRKVFIGVEIMPPCLQ